MKTLTTLVALLLAGSLYANTNGNMAFSPKKKVAISNNVESKYKLVYMDQSPGTVLINISNEKGEKVYNQSVTNTEGFAQQFDFTSLPEGKYSFEIIHPDGSSEIEVVNYVKKIATSLKANLLNVDNGNKYRLAVLNNNGPVDVKIFDANDRLVHSTTVRGEEGFRRIYDLKGLNSTYKFEVSDNSGSLSLVTE